MVILCNTKAILTKMPEHLEITDRFPTLKTIGLAVEYFPRYVNQGAHTAHTHAHVEMTLVLSGQCRSLVADQEFVQKAGSLSVVNYGQTHRILTDPSGADLFNVYLDARTFQFPELPDTLAPYLVSWVPIHPAFVHEQNRCLIFDWGDPTRMQELLHLVLREQTEKGAAYQTAMQAAFSLFLLEGARHLEAQVRLGLWPLVLSSVAHPLERLRLRIDRNPEAALHLEDLSRELGISKSHLCRRFKLHTGKTIIGYAHTKRIEKALHLLLTTQRKVLDIAQECGFEDLGQFNRKFKQMMGRRPGDFRRKATLPLDALGGV